ncbi:hypothetical protein GGF43_001534, partial [Coemansia sp. RSA 2618]
WAYAWREIRGDVPASGELALRLQAYVDACIERDNARQHIDNARRDIAKANAQLDQFTAYLGPPGSGGSEPPSWATGLVTALQAVFNKAQNAVASAVHTLNAAKEHVAAAAQA